MDAGWRFDNSYSRLPASFYACLDPEPVLAPRLMTFNRALAEQLGLNVQALAGEIGVSVFSGNSMPFGAKPIAQAYAGHQFGRFRMLGDGRAILLGEQITPDGFRFDVQLKGSGRTPFSRDGDGRAALGPMLREYIISEAMYALGIPTTRSLAVITSGESVYRQTVQPGAVLTRIAASHIRVGTFEYAADRLGCEGVRVLADYTIARHYPGLVDTGNRYFAFLQAAADRQAALVAKWMLAGFVHGVMNTDNMAVSGETIDYGPCAFIDVYDPGTVFSSIDREGRYAYGRQPAIAQWNLARLAETLLPLLHENPGRAATMAGDCLDGFPDLFRRYWFSGMRAKLGLVTMEDDDAPMIDALLCWMQESRADYTSTFRALPSDESLRPGPFAEHGFADWHARWRARLGRQDSTSVHDLMRANNPAIIPRNHLVEEALAAAVERADLIEFHRLLKALSSPYEETPDYRDCGLPPTGAATTYKTFCGT